MRNRKPRHRDANGSSRLGGCLIALLFGGVFAAAGTAMFIFLTILPLWRIYEASSWVATPCTISQSQVKTHNSSDGNTYSIEIKYTYQFNGQTYTGDTYRFEGPGSSSGYDSKKDAVDANPVGSQQTCYVDPNDPSRSVIQRGFNSGLWWGVFPIPFMGIGYAVLIAGLMGKIKVGSPATMNMDWRPTQSIQIEDDRSIDRQGQITSTPAGIDADIASGPVTFEPGKSRVVGFIAFGIFALIWNGIIGVIAYSMVSGMVHRNSGWEILPLLFLIPFVIIGLILLGASLRSLMLIFAPSIAVELGAGTLPLGSSTTLRWHILGRRDRVQSVTISLVGEEKATYRRGTDTTTDTKTFFDQVIVGEDPALAEMAPMSLSDERGEAVLSIPADTMHSFNATNNKIVWKLMVRAKVSRWPDPKDEYEITVLPLPIQNFN